MRMHVLFHDNCFDGAASAAAFSRFYRERIRKDATLTYQGLSHQAGGAPVPESAFQGDENAIVDFRYSQSPKLTWWFDHHASAFQNEGDEADFLADTSGRKFHDATRKSCTVFLADIARERFGSTRADGRAPGVGRDHRRRAVSEPADGGGPPRAGAAADDRARGQSRPRSHPRGHPIAERLTRCPTSRRGR
jgi:hypothetical protein